MTFRFEDLQHAQRALGGRGALGPQGRRPHEIEPPHLHRLAAAIRSGTYRPGPLRHLQQARDGKTRTLSIPTAVDRIVVQAWRTRWEPALDASLHDHVHGFRPGRDRFTAVARLLVPFDARDHLVQADIADLFEQLDHDRVLRALGTRLPGARTPGLPGSAASIWRPSRRFPVGALHGRLARVFGAPPRRRPEPHTHATPGTALPALWLGTWRPQGRGVPTGVAASPAWSNAMLGDALDPWLADLQSRRVVRALVRYADDLTFVVRGPPHPLLDGLTHTLQAAGLSLRSEKTRITPAVGPWPARVLGIPVSRSPRGDLVRAG